MKIRLAAALRRQFSCRLALALAALAGRGQGAGLLGPRDARRQALRLLAEARLKKGPVALYFYPKAFTQGCTIEAHDFAEASDGFTQQGATVIGVSIDDIATLDKFSVSDCRNKFAVASADLKLINSYDVAFPNRPLSNRTTYVIAPNGKILWTFTALKPDGHVAGALKAVTDWRTAHPQRS